MPDADKVPEQVRTWAAADAKFAGILATSSSSAAALARWSLELLAADRIPEAVSAIRSALALVPLDPALWSNYGAALNAADQPGDAIACLEHSLELSRLQPDTWLLLGMARKKSGDFVGAENAYQTALGQEPRSLAAWQLLGLLKEERKDFPMAVNCLKACMEIAGPTAPLLAYVGKLSHNLGRFAEAFDSYGRASGLDPANRHYHLMGRRCGFISSLINGSDVETALGRFRESAPPGEKVSEKELADLLGNAFAQLSGFGHREAAARLGRKRLELQPDNASLKYLLEAVTGSSTLDRSPENYVVEHFDEFAEGFEARLVGALDYDVPGKIHAEISRWASPGFAHETLDAGCGTGLCGPLLRPLSRRLAGVDLSPKMLEQAGKKGVYDTLDCEEVVAFLRRSIGRFDLMVAADLMIYFGDLRDLMDGAFGALRPGGLMAFSTESFTGPEYQLQASGRFAHSAEYVKSLAAGKLRLLSILETTIRMEATMRLPGNIFVFRRI